MKAKHILILVLTLQYLVLPGILHADETAVVSDSGERISITIDIRTATTTLLHSDIFVSACSTSASGTPTFNGYCAVMQSGLESEWSEYGDDRFLSSIGGVANDFSNNLNWNWFSNLEYGQTSLNQHTLVPGEKLLISMGRMPLKITISTTTPYVGSTTMASVYEFGFDDSWNATWLAASSSSVRVGEEVHPTDAYGHYEIMVSTTTPFVISAWKDGFIETEPISVSPISVGTHVNPIITTDDTDEATTTTDIDVATTTTTTHSDTPTPTDTSNGTGGRTSVKTFNVQSALQFLLGKQKSDGSFGSSLYSDWVALALASSGTNAGRSALISYLKADTSMKSVTDYERRAMALMAFNINPYNGTSINYIEHIVDSFDGKQFGDSSYVNDDIFALFPLIKAGYSIHDSLIQKGVEFILSEQKSDGSWAQSIDLTAAAIQSLSQVKDMNGVPESLTKARTYIFEHQESDGGFDSGFSTSWVLQAIDSLNESDSDWKKNGKSPEDFLAELQQSDGGVESVESSVHTRIWVTAYAIPAILHKSWPDSIRSFSRHISVPKEKNLSVVTVDATSTAAVVSENVFPEGQSESPVPTSIGSGTDISNAIEEDRLDEPELIQPETSGIAQVSTDISVPETNQFVAAIGDTKNPFSKNMVGMIGIIALAGVLLYKLKK